MSILKFIFGPAEAEGPPASDPQPVSCEPIEKRRCSSRKAYYEEHLFGYVDHDGNLSSTPVTPRS